MKSRATSVASLRRRLRNRHDYQRSPVRQTAKYVNIKALKTTFATLFLYLSPFLTERSTRLQADT